LSATIRTGTNNPPRQSTLILIDARISSRSSRYRFAGLKAGDRWCLCAPRWQEAFLAGAAPRVFLRATEMTALQWCSLDDLKRFAVDLV